MIVAWCEGSIERWLHYWNHNRKRQLNLGHKKYLDLDKASQTMCFVIVQWGLGYLPGGLLPPPKFGHLPPPNLDISHPQKPNICQEDNCLPQFFFFFFLAHFSWLFRLTAHGGHQGWEGGGAWRDGHWAHQVEGAWQGGHGAHQVGGAWQAGHGAHQVEGGGGKGHLDGSRAS